MTEPIKLVRRKLPAQLEVSKQVETDAVLDELVRMLCESQPVGYQLGSMMWRDDALHVVWVRNDSNVVSLEVWQDGD